MIVTDEANNCNDKSISLIVILNSANFAKQCRNITKQLGRGGKLYHAHKDFSWDSNGERVLKVGGYTFAKVMIKSQRIVFQEFTGTLQ